MLQNPEMIQMALNSPQLRQMAQNNPNMQALLNNPELISTNDKSTNNANDV